MIIDYDNNQGLSLFISALSGISEVDRLSPPVNGASPSQCDSAHLEKKKAVVPDQPNTPNIEVQVSARMYGAPPGVR